MVLAVIAAIGTHSNPAHADAAAGKAFSEKNCSRCHAIGLEGESAKPKAPAFRRLHELYPIESLAEAFAEGIVTSHSNMPQFELDPKTIDDLLGYIESLAPKE